MTDLIRLAERVEALTGPDRRLDLEIAIAVWGRPGVLVMRHDEETGKDYEHTYWKYTESLDAAMTLVPKGWSVLMSWNSRQSVGNVHLKPLGDPSGLWPDPGHAPTAPLALAAAALRALSQRTQS